MSARNPMKKPNRLPIRMPTRSPARSRRVAHRAIRPNLANTLGADAANLSVATPGRMSTGGDQPHTETPQQPVGAAKGKALPLPKTRPTRGRRGGRRIAGRR